MTVQRRFHLAILAAALAAAPAFAQETKVAIAISGWTGFAPLTLANEAGLFKKHGLDVTIKKIPQKDRHLAIASGDVQCAATTVETWVGWNANGVTTTQIFQLDKSYGADGLQTLFTPDEDLWINLLDQRLEFELSSDRDVVFDNVWSVIFS